MSIIYDLGNLCEMFKSVLKSILIANDNNRCDDVIMICDNAIKNIERLQKYEDNENSDNDECIG